MSEVDKGILDALRAATADEARPAGPGDDVDGVAPSYVASPCGTEETAATLRVAAEHGLAVIARGTGSRLSWGAPPSRADLVVDTARMDRIVEHRAGDLVVHAEAGVRLDTLHEHLARAGQRLAIDPVLPPGGTHGGTVGGLIATAASGPLRLSHGAVRDLLIGVTMVRADGVVAKAGGKVVKNVAGYDLGKVLTGSWGTLGLVTEAVFRLHPLPVTARWVVRRAGSAAEAYDLVRRVVHSQVVPAGLELDRAPGEVATLAASIEGIPAGVTGRVGKLVELLGESTEVRDSAPDWWGRAPWGSGDVAMRLTHEIAGLPKLLDALDEAAARHGLSVALRGSVGVGVVHAGVPGAAEPDAVGALVKDLRDQSSAWGGDVVVLDAPPAVKASVDVWGPVRGLALMRRVKDQFDPEHRLAPGRFAGGI
ncbi:FAD-binding oxidoreductase [Amycolatopsis taiwanensis]|uniref:FAD-linked oxidase n=1 Tax=Amycolatopsis taiwanensis TaxID=342230 RepID=A0A9W6QW08_9PSEU|nr:FAD-binding oxidoreductase [Amycolatopsis taiwanensis]GLY65119.1 FAD-linked oxidase [Amycolatopsis taiwanensis]